MEKLTSPFFLFLGDSDREGVTSKLKAAGIPYKKKLLESGVANWEKIISLFDDEDLFERHELTGVIVKLTNNTFIRMVSQEYLQATQKLLRRISHIPHIVFVHESFFLEDNANEDSDDSFYSHFFGNVPPEIRTVITDLFAEYDLNIAPYRTNAELSILAAEFVDDSGRRLIFRLYVPAKRMWAGETDKILNLFRDYLNRVSGLQVRQEQYATSQGVVYELFADKDVDPTSLPQEFEDFSRFLDACAIDPNLAQELLSAAGLDDVIVHDIVARYAKEAKRLQVDLKHERERKILGIRHRMESELVDAVGSDADWASVNRLIELTVPGVSGVSTAISFAGPRPLPPASRDLTINVRPQIINSVHAIVAQEVTGTQNISTEAGQLLELIGKFGGKQSVDLTSAVYELEDKEAKPESRLGARQRIKAFLYKLGSKVSDTAFTILQSYIESKIGI
ncbi:MAG TPA: hypothetical protein VF693_09195 [Allosphingosinicella sp.]|jgi:hypothetical protein